MKINRLLITMAGLVMTGQAFASSNFQIAAPSNKIGEGRCYMDYCGYSKIVSTKIVQKNANAIKVKVSLLGGESHHKNGNYPKAGKPPKNIKWNKKPHQITAICSHENPALVMGNDVDDLDFSSIPGVMESSANLYFQICHNYYDGYYLGAVKFGYVTY